MAGVITITEMTWDSVRKIVAAWVSGTGADINKADGVTVNPFSGQIKRAVFIPGTAGDIPTDLYDVRVLDSDGIDILGGVGIDLDHDNLVEAFEGSATKNLNHMFAHTKLTFEVRAAGDTKKGTIVLYIR